MIGELKGKPLFDGDRFDEKLKENWHSLIDHLISGKDIESFFESLLSGKK